MVILIVESVPSGMRGELSRWLIEPRTGVFVGSLSGLVRDRLWEKVTDEIRQKGGAAILVHAARNEQGFVIRSVGDPDRTPVNWEGLTLIRVPEPAHRAPRKGKPGVLEKSD